MTPERRAEIIRQSLLNLHRYKSTLEDGASSPDVTARSDDTFPADRAVPLPPEDDPVERWRREGEEFERQRAAGRMQTRAEEEQHLAGQQEATDLFWQSVDARIAQALDAERAFYTNLLGDALEAVNEIADGTCNKFDELDQKLNSLAQLLEQLRAGNESALQRARAMEEILPNPLASRRGLN